MKLEIPYKSKIRAVIDLNKNRVTLDETLSDEERREITLDQAKVFGAYLTMPSELVESVSSVEELAERAGVTIKYAEFRLDLEKDPELLHYLESGESGEAIKWQT